METERLMSLLGQSHHIAFFTHENPDVDGLASIIVMGSVAESMGKKATVVSKDRLGEGFDHLQRIDWLRNRKEEGISLQNIPDLAVVIDAGNLGQVGKAYSENKASLASVKTVNIDHHSTNTMFGDVNLVDALYSSSSEIVLHYARSVGVQLEPWMAHLLLLGIIVDTSRFRTANVSSGTFRAAADLIDLGADYQAAQDAISEQQDASRDNLWRRIIPSIERLANNKILFVSVSEAQLSELEMTESELKGLANYMRAQPGAKVAILFVSRKDGATKISLRSKPGINVARLAERYGGGGHPEAAGAVIENVGHEELRREVFAAVEQLIGVAARGGGS